MGARCPAGYTEMGNYFVLFSTLFGFARRLDVVAVHCGLLHSIVQHRLPQDGCFDRVQGLYISDDTLTAHLNCLVFCFFFLFPLYYRMALALQCCN